MDEELLKQIKQKRDEVRQLEILIEKEGIKKYSFLVGEYYCLAATCYIKVLKIECIGDYGITVDCIRIQGGKHDGGRIDVDLSESYDLSFVDINEKRITKITKDKFESFLEEALNETKKRVMQII